MTDKCICEDFMITIRAENGGKFQRPFEIWTNTSLRDSNFYLKFKGVDQDMDRFDEAELKKVARYYEDWRAPG